MPLPFMDRRSAGRELAPKLQHLTSRHEVVVLALPRGGVPVAYEVARALHAPLDVFVVRKLGVPAHPELAIGAVASGGVRVLNEDTIRALHIPEHSVDVVTERERRELARRERAYRGNRPLPQLQGATVVLVDDGVATGSSMLAAVQALRAFNPAAIVAAAPVMAVEAATMLHRAADSCVWVAMPTPFFGVGAWYRDFEQTSDAEVRELLSAAARGQAVPEARHAFAR
jgi:predicted phosphoribosyltransferase